MPEGPGMLRGVRVLDLAGEELSFAGRVLGELGADVLLVEPPSGAATRATPPMVDTSRGVCVSAHFAYMAAGKRSVTLDHATPQGRVLFERLLRRADVVLLPDEDLDVLRRQAIDEGSLRLINDRLIVTSVSAFGMSGPRRHWRGSDLVAWASSGVLFGIGDPDRPPVAPGGGIASAVSALNAVLGTVLALRASRQRGRGQSVDISRQEAVLSVSMEVGPNYVLEGRPLNREGRKRTAAHGFFSVRDGEVEITAFLPTQWDALAEWIRDDLGVEEAMLDVFKGSAMDRIPYKDAINAWLVELTSRYTKQGFFAEAQRRGVPAAPVNDAADVLDDPHLRATDSWERVEHPDAGTISLPRGPVSFDGVRTSVGAVPRPGQHNVEVFCNELGMSESELSTLRANGVI